MGNMIFGLEVMLIGLVGVFAALTVLYILLVLLEKYFARKNGKAKPSSSEGGGNKKHLKLSLSSPVQIESDEEDPGEIIAVITAALAAYLQKPQASLAIRSISPVRETTSWKSYGRTRQMDLKSSFGAKRREKR